MGKSYAIAFAGSLVMSYVLAHAIIFEAAYFKMNGMFAGLMCGFWNWLGLSLRSRSERCYGKANRGSFGRSRTATICFPC